MRYVHIRKVLLIALMLFAIMAFASGVAIAGKGSNTPVTPTLFPALVLGQLSQAARTDLASRLGVPVSAITLQSATLLDWPDSSLGCANLSFAHLQVMTPGYLIVLSHQGKDHEYHSDLIGPPFSCEATRLAQATLLS